MTAAVFQLEKGGEFALEKSFTRVNLVLTWKAPEKTVNPSNHKEEPFDPDSSLFGLVNMANSKPVLYNGGSHAVGYFNTVLKQADNTLRTADGSIHHTGDDRGEGQPGQVERQRHRHGYDQKSAARHGSQVIAGLSQNKADQGSAGHC